MIAYFNYMNAILRLKEFEKESVAW